MIDTGTSAILGAARGGRAPVVLARNIDPFPCAVVEGLKGARTIVIVKPSYKGYNAAAAVRLDGSDGLALVVKVLAGKAGVYFVNLDHGHVSVADDLLSHMQSDVASPKLFQTQYLVKYFFAHLAQRLHPLAVVPPVAFVAIELVKVIAPVRLDLGQSFAGILQQVEQLIARLRQVLGAAAIVVEDRLNHVPSSA